MQNANVAKTFYIRTYGCQMNEYDSEIIAGILQRDGFIPALAEDEADIILLKFDNRALDREKVIPCVLCLLRNKINFRECLGDREDSKFCENTKIYNNLYERINRCDGSIKNQDLKSLLLDENLNDQFVRKIMCIQDPVPRNLPFINRQYRQLEVPNFNESDEEISFDSFY